jgi:hypothetical protein
MSVEALELGALFFMAGLDLDFAKRKGGPLSLAVRGWIISLALGLKFRSPTILPRRDPMEIRTYGP